jgi:hypothetical protein
MPASAQEHLCVSPYRRKRTASIFFIARGDAGNPGATGGAVTPPAPGVILRTFLCNQ